MVYTPQHQASVVESTTSGYGTAASRSQILGLFEIPELEDNLIRHPQQISSTAPAYNDICLAD